MKNLIMVLLLATSPIWAQNPIMEKYAGNDDFTTVTISPKMFQLIGMAGLADEEPEMAELINGLTGLKILVYENEEGKNRFNAQSLYSEAINTLVGKRFEELMDVKDGDDNVKFLIDDNGSFIQELLMLVGSEDEFVMINITGNIDLEQIGKISESIDVKGFDHLDKLKENNSNTDKDSEDEN